MRQANIAGLLISSFLIGSLSISAVIILTNINTDEMLLWGPPYILGQTAAQLTKSGITIISLLFATFAHGMIVNEWGLKAARYWGIAIISSSLVLLNLPIDFLHPHYTRLLGPQLWDQTPMNLSLLYYSLISIITILTKRVHPPLSSSSRAIIVAILVMIFIWMLNPFAARIQSWWLWDTPPSPFVLAAWGGLSYVVTLRFGVSKINPSTSITFAASTVGLVMIIILSARIIHGV